MTELRTQNSNVQYIIISTCKVGKLMNLEVLKIQR